MSVSGHLELAQALSDKGVLDTRWIKAWLDLPRANFAPERIWTFRDNAYRPIDRDDDPDEWLAALVADQAVVTSVAEDDDPLAAQVPMSSLSQPYMVARMLQVLAAEPGMRVLELGTGAGLTTGLLSKYLGEHSVVTVEYDPVLATRARNVLAKVGCEPRVIVGDGNEGYPSAGPYDRIICTYAVDRIPRAWVRQLADDGRIVTPFGHGLYNGVLLRLDKNPFGSLAGGVVDDASFMWNREATRLTQRDVMAQVAAIGDKGKRLSETSVSPLPLLESDDARWAVGLTWPHLAQVVGSPADPDNRERTLWLASEASWASVDYEPGAETFAVEQVGRSSLWTSVELELVKWLDQGSPSRLDYGLVLEADGYHRWSVTSTPDVA